MLCGVSTLLLTSHLGLLASAALLHRNSKQTRSLPSGVLSETEHCRGAFYVMKLGNPREVGCLDNGGSVFPPTPQDPLELSYCGDFEAKTVKRRIEGNNKIESHLVIINHSFKSMYDPTPDLPKPQIYCQLPNNRGRLECLKSKDPLAPSHMEWRPPINGIRLEHLHAIQADSPLFHIRKNVFEVNELFASEAWDKGEYYIVCAKHLYDLIDSDLRKLNLKPADGKKFEYSDTDLN